MEPVNGGRTIAAVAGFCVALALGACSIDGDSFDTRFCQEKRDAVSLSMATVNELRASLSSGTLTSDEVNRTFELGDGLMMSATRTVVDWQVCFTGDDVTAAKRYLNDHT